MNEDSIEQYILRNHHRLSFSTLAALGLHQLDNITYVFNELGHRWVQEGFLSEYAWTNLHYQLILAYQALGYSTVVADNTITGQFIPSWDIQQPTVPIVEQQRRY